MDDLFEAEAELAFHRTEEIDIAAQWCKDNYPHKLEFLNSVYTLLVEDERHMTKLGMPNAYRYGDIKPQPTLAILSPSQALRLLECYKRATINTPDAWMARNLATLDRIESRIRLAGIVAAATKSTTYAPKEA